MDLFEKNRESTPPEVIFEGENQTKESDGTVAEVGTGKDSRHRLLQRAAIFFCTGRGAWHAGICSLERKRASEREPSEPRWRRAIEGAGTQPGGSRGLQGIGRRGNSGGRGLTGPGVPTFPRGWAEISRDCGGAQWRAGAGPKARLSAGGRSSDGN